MVNILHYLCSSTVLQIRSNTEIAATSSSRIWKMECMCRWPTELFKVVYPGPHKPNLLFVWSNLLSNLLIIPIWFLQQVLCRRSMARRQYRFNMFVPQSCNFAKEVWQDGNTDWTWLLPQSSRVLSGIQVLLASATTSQMLHSRSLRLLNEFQRHLKNRPDMLVAHRIVQCHLF